MTPLWVIEDAYGDSPPPLACSEPWQFLGMEGGMQDSRYPMTGTNEVLVPAVGYGRVLNRWVFRCILYVKKHVFANAFCINSIDFGGPWGHNFQHFGLRAPLAPTWVLRLVGSLCKRFWAFFSIMFLCTFLDHIFRADFNDFQLVLGGMFGFFWVTCLKTLIL